MTSQHELVDLLGNTGNVPLSATTYEYDSLSRMTRVVDSWFDPVSQLPVGAGIGDVTYHFSGMVLESVTDAVGRVIGQENLWVLDASAIPEALGVNPQVTIASLALQGATQLLAH